MRTLALVTVCALGGALTLNAGTTSFSPDAQAQETPADVIAVQIRKQGFACGDAKSAERDADASKPDLPVWILKCDNASYRVRLTGNMADHVEKLKDHNDHN
jgi:hypothetical protein